MKNKDITLLLQQETKEIDIPMSKKLIDTPITPKKQTKEEPKLNRKKFLFPILASITCCLLVLCLCFAFIPFNISSTQLTSYILKINPEFCITTNSNNQVVNICSLNADADTVLDNSAFDNIIGTNFSDCVNLIINNVDESIFLNYGNKRISLFAINDNQNTANTKLNEFGNIVRKSLDDRGFDKIQFDKFDMTLEFFKNEMGFENNFNKLDDMQFVIEHHDRFFDKDHMPPPPKNPQ